jgi:hypothetical protein
MPKGIPLRDLEARLIEATEQGSRPVETVSEAQGVRFLCPLCYTKNGGSIGTHSVICWSRQVDDDKEPGPGRWSLHGNTIDDLTLHGDPVGGARSIQLLGGCGWHGYVNSGSAEEGF